LIFISFFSPPRGTEKAIGYLNYSLTEKYHTYPWW